MTNSNIPLSLTGPSSEFFTSDGRILKISNGVTEHLEKLPEDFGALLNVDMLKDVRVKVGLQKLKIRRKSEQVLKYFECNYSSFDTHSDLSACHTKLGPREYIPCEKRDTCPAHGFLCKIPGGLTIRQYEIAKRIALGQQDTQISIELYISIETLRTHKNGIEEKIGKKGKTSIGVWAVENNII